MNYEVVEFDRIEVVISALRCPNEAGSQRIGSPPLRDLGATLMIGEYVEGSPLRASATTFGMTSVDDVGNGELPTLFRRQ